MKYNEYMASEQWAEKRKEAFKHHGSFCHLCKTRKRLQIHHLSYKNLGDEPMKDLVPLCKTCHSAVHGIHGPDPVLNKIVDIIEAGDVKASLVKEWGKKWAAFFTNKSKYSKLLKRAIIDEDKH